MIARTPTALLPTTRASVLADIGWPGYRRHRASVDAVLATLLLNAEKRSWPRQEGKRPSAVPAPSWAGGAEGYVLHDTLPESSKLPGVRFRRIELKAINAEGKREVLTIASSGVMPYMTGLTDEVEKALFLRQFGVPYWGLTYVFGRDDSYWYRMTAGIGRFENSSLRSIAATA